MCAKCINDLALGCRLEGNRYDIVSIREALARGLNTNNPNSYCNSPNPDSSTNSSDFDS